MPREIVTINVGQCGIQLGECVWKQFCAEHNIDKNGNNKWCKDGPTKRIYPSYIAKDDDNFNHSISCLFEEMSDGRYITRNIMIDTEPNVIDDIKTSDYRQIYDHEFLLSGTQDAANIFSRGYHTIGKQMIDKINNKMRKLADHCDNLQGFIMNHSVGGGTGSGLGTLILETLAVDYRKKSKIGFEIYPSPIISTCVVEPYNALLTTHSLIDYSEICIVLDNEALYEICQKWLDIRKPSYNNINRLISKTISSITTSLRFNDTDTNINTDLQQLQTNLVPFPRLHFMITSLAPVDARGRRCIYSRDIQYITERCFMAQDFFTKISDFDADEDKYMAISANYRGDVTEKEANATVQWLKINKKVSFVEWCPTGFKIGINEEPIAVLWDADDIAPSRKSISMVGNNTAIGRTFRERISEKYDLMYAQRSFVHWYIVEGMEESQFVDAREDLWFLELDYLDVLSEMETDEESDNDIVEVS